MASLTPDGKTLEPEPAEQATIAQVKELHSNGLSISKIVAEMAQRCVVERTGKPLDIA